MCIIISNISWMRANIDALRKQLLTVWHIFSKWRIQIFYQISSIFSYVYSIFFEQLFLLGNSCSSVAYFHKMASIKLFFPFLPETRNNYAGSNVVINLQGSPLFAILQMEKDNAQLILFMHFLAFSKDFVATFLRTLF